MKAEKDYEQAVAWIHSIGRFGMKPGLERISALLERFGNPQERLHFVHIGGTNGKGSTAAALASILQAAGYRVGLFTSPYFLSFTDRMVINGADIDGAELAELVSEVRPAVEAISKDPERGHATQFEVVTALAMLFFERRQVDLVVLEVGLGGRLDATNVVTPLLSVITNVTQDHTAVLGDTISAIAAEKAGSIKPAVPLVTATTDPAVLAVLQERCRALGAPLYRVLPREEARGGAEQENAAFYWRQGITPEGQRFAYRGFQRSFEDLFIPLRGAYQVANGATALAAAELLAGHAVAVDEEAMCRGLAQVTWPGRLEVVRRDPLLVLDGAHNPAAATALAASFPEYFNYRHLILVMGIMEDKDVAGVMRPLLPLARSVIFSRPDLPRAAAPGDLAAIAREHLGFTGPIAVEPAVKEAVQKALAMADPADAVLVTGSFYTISEARAHLC